MRWTHSLKAFCLVVALSSCFLPLPCESLVNWDLVVEDLEKVKALDPVLSMEMATHLLGILGSYDQSIAQRDQQILDQARRLTEYDKAYTKVSKNLTISYVALGAAGGVALGGLVWGLVEHFTPR